MTEYEMLKTMLVRTGNDLHIEDWETLDEQVIFDKTTKTWYWFKNYELDYACDDDR